MDEVERLAGVQRQVGRNYPGLPRETLSQGLGRRTGSRGKETVEEENERHGRFHRAEVCVAGSAAAAVEVAGRTVGYGAGVQAGLFGHEGDGAVVEYETGYAHRSRAFGAVECRVGVAQPQKGFEVSHVPPDVDHFVAAVAFDLLLDVGAVGAGAHAIYLDHNGYSDRFRGTNVQKVGSRMDALPDFFSVAAPLLRGGKGVKKSSARELRGIPSRGTARVPWEGGKRYAGGK